jgi:nitrogen regulatory protein PII
MKKIEIIFPKHELDQVTNLLQKNQIPGYTIIEVYSGYGKYHGTSLELGFSSSQSLLYLFAVDTAENIEALIPKIQGTINEIGALLISYAVQVH